ncbi:acyltransferase family protein [Streptomyces sp. WMMC897]|uniref:acyltransferase family protein n=1 Tax=Streptomyces sp. WMMC897 TaxID=3014782 RepID=UPI0022B6CA95|nr:acyltransferase family protein [Streptomyces sp. WMMC897]MCZ7414225.1 hypothetical protein [Streptomyces sp. WMMC897]
MFHAASRRSASPAAVRETPDTTWSTAPAQPAPAAGSECRPVRARDPFLDNAKFLTIVLVGMGHAWAPLTSESRAVAALYIAVYTFHMPAFALISGYLSRSFQGRPEQVRRLVTGVAVPYVVFEVVYTLFMRQIGEPDRPLSLFSPGYALWFLCALFVWRLSAPIWRALRWPLPVALGIAAAAAATPGIGDELDLMRVLQFLPFFVLGLQLRPEHFELVKRPGARAVALPVLLGAVAVAYWAVPRMNHEWMLHNRSAQELGSPWWVGVVMTFAVFGCAVLLTACMLAWTPRRTVWFTALGAGTVCGYLLHVYPIQLARQFDWYAFPGAASPTGCAVITLLAFAMMTVLCTPAVHRAVRPLVEPRMAWFFDRTPAPRSPERVSTPGAR